MNKYQNVNAESLQAIRGTAMLAAEAATQLADQLDASGTPEGMVRADQLVNRIAAQLSAFDSLRQGLTAEAREHMKAIERQFGPPEQMLKNAIDRLRDSMDRVERRMLDARPFPPAE